MSGYRTLQESLDLRVGEGVDAGGGHGLHVAPEQDLSLRAIALCVGRGEPGCKLAHGLVKPVHAQARRRDSCRLVDHAVGTKQVSRECLRFGIVAVNTSQPPVLTTRGLGHEHRSIGLPRPQAERGGDVVLRVVLGAVKVLEGQPHA